MLETLLEKAIEALPSQEKLVFFERLFHALEPEQKTEFLVGLAKLFIDSGIDGRAFGANCAPYDRSGPMPTRCSEPGPVQECCREVLKLVDSQDEGSSGSLDVARIFNALADETRIRIVKLVCGRSMTVEELVEALGMAQSTVSHHLKVLKEADLVRAERCGRNTRYSLTVPLGGGSS